MYYSNLFITCIIFITSTVWARCICDPADNSCFNECVNSARNCILQCSENNVCLNSCVVTHLPEDFLQNYIASVKENEIETMEHQELPIKNNNRKRLVAAPLIRDGHRRHEDNYYDNQPVHTVAHAPDLTPLVNGVIGQLLPYILQAIGSNRPPAVRGGQPTLMGGQPTYAAALPPQPTQQPYSGGQTNVGGGLPVQPGMGGGLPRQPAMGGGQAGQPYMGSSPGQPDMGSSPGQPGMGGVPGNEVPPMNGQPPMNVPPPAMTAPPALPSSPAMNNPQPPLDPSLMTTHTTLVSLTTAAPDASASFVPTNIFHLSGSVKSNSLTFALVGFFLLFTTYILV